MNGDWNPTSKSWGTERPTWEWIKEQQDLGQDVEIVIRWEDGAHWDTADTIKPAKGLFDDDPASANILTLAGYSWDDANSNGIFDNTDSLLWDVSDPHQAVSQLALLLWLRETGC